MFKQPDNYRNRGSRVVRPVTGNAMLFSWDLALAAAAAVAAIWEILNLL